MAKLPLEGIRIVDFGQMWAGPHLTQWLAVMGAEVIKIETVLRIDFMRLIGVPPQIEQTNPNAGTGFASINFNKKSITLNMNQTKAIELARRLIQKSDVVTENFSGPILERWGLGYEKLKELNPQIIVYAGSGYGRSGLHASRPAYAEIVEAMDGSSFANGYPGGPPATLGVSPWTDATQSMNGAFAIMAAIYHRNDTGEGQCIDAAMIEGSVNFLSEMVMDYNMNGNPGERLGNHDKIMAPHGCYRCSGTDEWVAIAVSNQKEWRAFCQVLGNPDWTRLEEFSDELSRWKNQDKLDRLVEQWTLNYHPSRVMELLQKAGVMAGMSHSVRDLVDDPQLKERKFFFDVDHPVLGNITLAGIPLRLSKNPLKKHTPPPLLGEHNDYVFGQLLSLSKEEIAALKEEKVLY